MTPARPSYLVIVNPVAGKGAGAVRAEALRVRLSREHDVQLVETTGRGHATHIAREHGGAVDRVVAVGGDGTLNEVLCGVLTLGGDAEARPALGFLPGGTANVATKAFRFEPDPALAVEVLAATEGRHVDVGVADVGGLERPFLLWCGVGIDAVVIDRLNSARTGRMGLAGLLVNTPRVIAAVARYAAPDVHVLADGVDLPPVASLILSNVAEIAFGGVVHGEATPFDGRVDVVTIERLGPLGIVGMTARVFGGGLTSHPDVGHRVATRLSIRSDDRVPVQIDGEPVGHLPAEVRMLPGAVRLLVPVPSSRYPRSARSG